MKVAIRTRRSRLVLAGLAVAACSAIWAGMAAGDSPEAREVKERFTGQAGRIGSLEVSYSLTTSSDLKPAQLLALSSFRNQLFLPKDDWTEAFNGEKRYRRGRPGRERGEVPRRARRIRARAAAGRRSQGPRGSPEEPEGP